MKCFKRLKKIISNEMKVQLLTKQYVNQLNEYMKDQGEQDDLRYLRHDIMNYLQTYHEKGKHPID